MMTKIYLTFGIYLWLSFLIVRVPSMQKTKVQKYIITHDGIYDWDIKKKYSKNIRAGGLQKILRLKG